MAPGAPDPVQAWLGSTWIHNESRGVDEELFHYLLRHTRLIPRDLVSLGNSLSQLVLRKRSWAVLKSSPSGFVRWLRTPAAVSVILNLPSAPAKLQRT